MSLKYLGQFTNRNICSWLVEKADLDMLERIIEEKSTRASRHSLTTAKEVSSRMVDVVKKGNDRNIDTLAL